MARARKVRRIPEWMIGVAITLVVLVMGYMRPSFLETLEYQVFDLHLKWFGAQTAPQNIAIVAIDEGSITKVGRWPWPRPRITLALDLERERQPAKALTV
jgi:CHASE2 domain-containing sensor protein